MLWKSAIFCIITDIFIEAAAQKNNRVDSRAVEEVTAKLEELKVESNIDKVQESNDEEIDNQVCEEVDRI